MAQTDKLTVFYDGACPLCERVGVCTVVACARPDGALADPAYWPSYLADMECVHCGAVVLRHHTR